MLHRTQLVRGAAYHNPRATPGTPRSSSSHVFLTFYFSFLAQSGDGYDSDGGYRGGDSGGERGGGGFAQQRSVVVERPKVPVLQWAVGRSGKPQGGIQAGRCQILPAPSTTRVSNQGLTLAHFRAELQDPRDTLLTSQLNLSTVGTHPRDISGTKEP